MFGEYICICWCLDSQWDGSDPRTVLACCSPCYTSAPSIGTGSMGLTSLSTFFQHCSDHLRSLYRHSFYNECVWFCEGAAACFLNWSLHWIRRSRLRIFVLYTIRSFVFLFNVFYSAQGISLTFVQYMSQVYSFVYYCKRNSFANFLLRFFIVIDKIQ